MSAESDEATVSTLQRFAERKLQGQLSEDGKALYWDIINAVQYVRRLEWGGLSGK